jgi:hypothetical protein
MQLLVLIVRELLQLMQISIFKIKNIFIKNLSIISKNHPTFGIALIKFDVPLIEIFAIF